MFTYADYFYWYIEISLRIYYSLVVFLSVRVYIHLFPNAFEIEHNIIIIIIINPTYCFDFNSIYTYDAFYFYQRLSDFKVGC